MRFAPSALLALCLAASVAGQFLQKPLAAQREWLPWGINFGNTFSVNPLPPADYFAILRDIGLNRIKMFDGVNETNLNAIKSVYGDEANVWVGLAVWDLPRLASDYSWALEQVERLRPYRSIVTGLAVGNEPLDHRFNGKYEPHIVPALDNVRRALKQAGMSDIRTVIPFDAGFLQDSYPAAWAKVNQTFAHVIVPVLERCREDGTPFVVNLYPYFVRAYSDDVGLDCAIGVHHNPQPDPAGYVYSFLLAPMYDSVVAALDKAGFPDVPVVLGETGWPTLNGRDTNPDNARTFLMSFDKMAREGTHLAKRPLEMFYFSAFDEYLKTGDTVEPHFGLFFENGTHKYEWPFKNTKLGAKQAHRTAYEWVQM